MATNPATTGDPIEQLRERIRDARGLGKKYVRFTIPEAVRLLNAAQTCDREHVPYRTPSRSDNRFFGDENNG